MGDVLTGPSFVSGRVRAYSVFPNSPTVNTTNPDLKGLWLPKTHWGRNAVLYGWGEAAAKLLSGRANGNYSIGGMYLEYKNVASAGDAVAVPAFTRAGGISYYNGLSVSPNVDYLRVPLTSAVVSSSDPTLFPLGNVITYFAQSQGTVGVHGKAFNDSVHSKIYGGALVAIPDLADRTQDIVFSRFYFDAADQQVKLSTSQLGMEWQITLN